MTLPATARACFTVDDTNAGRRLDAVVRRVCPDVPLAALMKWMRTGVVRVNGRKAKPNVRLVGGDEITLPGGPPPATRPRGRRLPALEILYEDADLMVVLKPAGLACHAGTLNHHDSLVARLVQYLDAFDAPPGHSPGLIQRLDKGVSGVLPVGKHAAALRVLSEEVSQGHVDKVYTALLQGRVRRPQGVIDVPLRIDDQPMGNKPRAHPDPAGKPAFTEYTVVRRFAHATLVEVRIRTGRTHQIRAHMRALGHPILGDPRYGQAAVNLPLHTTHGLDRPFLHAGRLSLRHPESGETLQFEAPLPADLSRLLRALSEPTGHA